MLVHIVALELFWLRQKLHHTLTFKGTLSHSSRTNLENIIKRYCFQTCLVFMQLPALLLYKSIFWKKYKMCAFTCSAFRTWPCFNLIWRWRIANIEKKVGLNNKSVQCCPQKLIRILRTAEKPWVNNHSLSVKLQSTVQRQLSTTAPFTALYCDHFQLFWAEVFTSHGTLGN